MIKTVFKGLKVRAVIMAILLAVACLLTYYYHAVLGTGTVFTHFFYIPIILASLWWKRKGLFVAIFLAVVLILSHIFLRPDMLTINDYLRAFMLIAVSLLTAMLSERLANTEETLRETRDYLDSLLRYANAPIIVWDTKQRITIFNTAFERLTGYKAAEAVGQPLRILFPEESRDESLTKIEQTLSSEYWESVEIPILRKDGGIRTALWNSANIYDKGGKTLLATIAQGQDITERKQAEEMIAHLNLVLRAIRNVNQIIIRENDRDRLLKRICDNLVGTRGYSNAWIALLDESGKLVAHAESGLGKSFLPMVEQLKRGELTACGQRTLQQPEAVVTEDPASTCTDCSLSSSYAGRSGVTARLEYEGKVYGLLAASVPGEMVIDAEELSLFHEVATDIAFALCNMELEERRKQAEEDLQESEERYRTLFEKTANPILIIGTEGNYIDCNEAALEFVECTREELLTKNVRDFIPPGKEKQVLKEHETLWVSGGIKEIEYCVKGKVKILELTITPTAWRVRRQRLRHNQLMDTLAR